MQTRTPGRLITVLRWFDTVAVVVGIPAFTAGLVLELGSAHVSPFWVIINIAMIIFCCGDAFARLVTAAPLTNRRIVGDSCALLAGGMLTISVSIFAITSTDLSARLALVLAGVFVLGAALVYPAYPRLCALLAARREQPGEQP